MTKNKGGWRRGDIILVSFPFTDLLGKKTRPALVMSSFGNDFIIVGIFTLKSTFRKLRPTWLFIEDDGSQFFKQTGLKKTSLLKAEKIAVVHQSVIQKKLGKVSELFMRQVESALKKALQFRS